MPPLRRRAPTNRPFVDGQQPRGHPLGGRVEVVRSPLPGAVRAPVARSRIVCKLLLVCRFNGALRSVEPGFGRG